MHCLSFNLFIWLSGDEFDTLFVRHNSLCIHTNVLIHSMGCSLCWEWDKLHQNELVLIDIVVCHLDVVGQVLFCPWNVICEII